VRGRDVLVTGGTGYIGRRLIAALLERGHRVRALVRPESAAKLPAGATPVMGDALDASSVLVALRQGDVLVHLVGTPHPSPSKAEEFKKVDLASIRASVRAAARAGVSQLVYLSVAQPAPVMEAYLTVRAEGERLIGGAGLTATVLRPWYVLGPGHLWPIVLVPLYALARLVPSLRESAERLGLVSISEMVGALVLAIEHPPPPATVRVLDVPAIRSLGCEGGSCSV
jgi:uncharacterized protein YbjT (DUF2867 family)